MCPKNSPRPTPQPTNRRPSMPKDLHQRSPHSPIHESNTTSVNQQPTKSCQHNNTIGHRNNTIDSKSRDGNQKTTNRLRKEIWSKRFYIKSINTIIPVTQRWSNQRKFIHTTVCLKDPLRPSLPKWQTEDHPCSMIQTSDHSKNSKKS